jgi:arginine deiminase
MKRALRSSNLQLSVFSEITKLRDVLVHAPGPEVDVMPPSMMSELLFDDIIYGPRARQEHGRFRSILERFGVTVHDIRDLLRDTLEAASDSTGELIGEVAKLEGLDDATVRILEATPPAELADMLIQGLRMPPERFEPADLFALDPIPNLLFSRDAQTVLGDQMIIAAMNRRARQRESILSRFVFSRHPRLESNDILMDFSRSASSGRSRQSYPSTFEGGDLLVFREGIVVVGVSERTMEASVDLLAKTLRQHGFFHTLIMVPMPRVRNAMHLDTIFTRISMDECLVHAPMILSGNHETLSVVRIDLRKPDDWGTRHPSLLDGLESVGVKLTPIYCGGQGDYIRQCREQWTDGANSFAIAPGIIMTYSRNAATANELARHGYNILQAAELDYADDGSCQYDFVDGKKYAILVCGEELSRARGGPRCMTMPLARETL